MRTNEVRVYYREPIAFYNADEEIDYEWHPRGMVMARYNEETGLIDLGFALCSDKDFFSYEVARSIAFGRLESGRYSVNPEQLRQLEIVLPDAPDGQRSPFSIMMTEFIVACNEVIQRRQYLLNQQI